MSAPRRFDHDEARRRYAAGETKTELARSMGVNATSVARAVDPARAAAHAAWVAGGTCCECGAPCRRRTRKRSMERGARGPRCRDCGYAPRRKIDVAEAARLVSGGSSKSEVARRFGVTPQAVTIALAKVDRESA